MQPRPWPLAIVSLAVMLAFLVPVFALRLDTSDAGNDPTSTSTYTGLQPARPTASARASTAR